MREKLPDRRACWSQKARIGGTTCHLSVGEYDDGRPGEIFLNVDRAGSTLRAMLDSFAINFSIALQSGAPLETLIAAHKGIDFLPQGPITAGGSPVQKVTSIVDWVAKELEHAYLRKEMP